MGWEFSNYIEKLGVNIHNAQKSVCRGDRVALKALVLGKMTVLGTWLLLEVCEEWSTKTSHESMP